MDARETQVRLDIDGDIATVTLDRPARRNALGPSARRSLLKTLRRALYEEARVRAVVLSGAGGYFCAGADVANFAPTTLAHRRASISEVGEIAQELVAGPKPVVAAVEGGAFGMGLSLALACDIVVAGRHARLGPSFVRMGLLPDTGILWTMASRVGSARAGQLLRLGRECTGDETLELGLVNRLVDDGQALEQATAIARALAALPTRAAAVIKMGLTHRSATLGDALRAEMEGQPVLRQSEEHLAAVRAFAGRRRAPSGADRPPVPGDRVRVERQGGVAVVTLNEPERRNPFSQAMRLALLETLERLFYDEADIGAIVLTGAGGNFCAGGDIAEMDAAPGWVESRQRVALAGRIADLLVTGPKPVVAAVEGHCSGAGLSLAAACDVVVGARDSVYTCAFVKMGLMPDTGLLWTLPRRVGASKARELLLTGGRMGCEDAARIGLVDQIGEPAGALQTAVARAGELAALPSQAVMLLKGVPVADATPLAQVMAREADLVLLARGAMVRGAAPSGRGRGPAERIVESAE